VPLRARDNAVVTPDLTFPADRSLSVDTDDGARLVVEVAGDGPLVVVLHGTLVSSAVLGPLARRLVAEGYAVAAQDLRGHGRSTAGRERFSIRGYGRDLARVIETLAPEAYVLVGHSSGGMGALAFAEDPGTARPPSRLVLISTSASSIGGPKERLAAPVLFNGGLGMSFAVRGSDARSRGPSSPRIRGGRRWKGSGGSSPRTRRPRCGPRPGPCSTSTSRRNWTA